MISGHGEHKGNIVCGKTIQYWGGTFIAFFGVEVKLSSFEVLVADNPNMLKWVPASGGQ